MNLTQSFASGGCIFEQNYQTQKATIPGAGRGWGLKHKGLFVSEEGGGGGKITQKYSFFVVSKLAVGTFGGRGCWRREMETWTRIPEVARQRCFAPGWLSGRVRCLVRCTSTFTTATLRTCLSLQHLDHSLTAASLKHESARTGVMVSILLYL